MKFYIKDQHKNRYHRSMNIFNTQIQNLLPGSTWKHNHITYHIDRVEYLQNETNVYMTKVSM